MRALLLFSIFFISLNGLNCQIVEGFDYTKYPAPINSSTQKAKLNFNSNPSAKMDKKQIVNGYESGTITFAGYYVTIIWACGNNCLKGVMVDTRSGNIYNLPISSQTATNHCIFYEDVFDRYLFLSTSKLFITSTCKELKNIKTGNIVQNQTFFVHLWNDKLKKFDLIKKINKSREI